MLSTMKPSNSTKRTKKPKPLFQIFHQGSSTNENQQTSNNNTSSPVSSTSLGSGSSVPLSSVITSPTKTRAPPIPSPSRGRQRSKSVGRPSDQRSLARQQSFNKLCALPPVPPMNTFPVEMPTMNAAPTPKQTTSTPARHLRKHSSAHDLKKAHQKEYQELHANRFIPLPNSPIHHSRRHNNHHGIGDDDDDDDDDIPLADAMRRLPSGPPSPAMPHSPHSRHHRHHRPNITSPIMSPTRQFHYQQQPTYSAQPYHHPNSSLLNDDQEDDDEDLVPIARLKIADHHQRDESNSFLRSAADKYKEKVKERLLMDDPPSSSNPMYR